METANPLRATNGRKSNVHIEESRKLLSELDAQLEIGRETITRVKALIQQLNSRSLPNGGTIAPPKD